MDVQTLIQNKLDDEYNTHEKVKSSGEVFTPFRMINQMLDYFPKEIWSDPNQTWFDNCAGLGNFHSVVLERLMDGLKKWEPDHERRYKHIVENQLYFIELNQESHDFIQSFFNPHGKYKLNLKCGDALKVDFSGDGYLNRLFNEDDGKSYIMNNGIMNPPYNNNLYVKFLSRMFNKITGKMVSVQPATFLLEEKGDFQLYKDLKEKIKHHVEEIHLFNGNKDFGIALWLPCCIIVIDKSRTFDTIKVTDEIRGTVEEYENIHAINQYGNIPEYFSLKEKIQSHKGRSIWNVFKSHKTPVIGDKFVIPFTAMRGNVFLDAEPNEKLVKDDYYTIISGKKKIYALDEYKDYDRQYWIQFFFGTREEAENFLVYLKQKISRFAVSIYKVNQHLDSGELSLLPYLDFTKKWTDVELKKEFSITDAEFEFIDSVIPDYY